MQLWSSPRLETLARALRVATLAPALLPACGAPAPQPPEGAPNILLVTLDTTRADHLGAYGYMRDTSPVFDALAGESILFEHALAPMATTLPTHISIFTATHPLEHGVLANSTQGGKHFVPSPTLRSFASVAREAGYATAAFVSATPLKRGSGAEVGFEHYDQPGLTDKQRRSDATTDAALAWLTAQSRPPFFLWVHYFDAHWPFEPPAPFDTRFETDPDLENWLRERRVAPSALRELTQVVEEARTVNNLYDGELRYQDSQLGRLLDGLRAADLWEETAIVVVGDHGEGLCQHGETAHGGTWGEQLRVPLLIRVPGVAPTRVTELVSLLDVFPTLVGLLDVEELDAFGVQASGLDALADDSRPRPILSQDTGREREMPYRYALTSERWKYFRIEELDGSRSERLYDLAADPFELSDVSAANPAVAGRLRAILDDELAQRRARGEALRGGEAPLTREADPRVLEQLRALGYVDAEGPDPGT